MGPICLICDTPCIMPDNLDKSPKAEYDNSTLVLFYKQDLHKRHLRDLHSSAHKPSSGAPSVSGALRLRRLKSCQTGCSSLFLTSFKN
jgi:hypothetical protein